MAQESLALAALKARTQKKTDEPEDKDKPMSLGALAASTKKPEGEPAKKYTIHGDGKPAPDMSRVGKVFRVASN